MKDITEFFKLTLITHEDHSKPNNRVHQTRKIRNLFIISVIYTANETNLRYATFIMTPTAKKVKKI